MRRRSDAKWEDEEYYGIDCEVSVQRENSGTSEEGEAMEEGKDDSE